MFPEEPVLPAERAMKLAERWGSHTRSVHPTEAKKKAVDEDLRRWPGLDLYDTFLSNARSRY